MKSKFLLLLFWGTISCCYSQNNVYGKYICRFNPGYAELSLNKDNSFTYFVKHDLCEKYFEGKWQLRNNKLFLEVKNPVVTNISTKARFNITYLDEDTDNKSLQVFQNGAPLPLALIDINNGDYSLTCDTVGLVVLPQGITIRKITINAIGFKQLDFKVKKIHSKIVVEIFDEFRFQCITFDKITIWKFKGDALYQRVGGKSNIKEPFYKVEN